mmetsp:Transcript_18617/g.40514  ORF Transcript_18617/g.40514 Transcript_18617/m.40514 type:complete len:215 (+) Transcript_18617:1143-1787(+)
MTITLGNIVGNILPELKDTLRVGISTCTSRTNSRPHFLRSGDDVGRECGGNIGIFNAVFGWQITQRQHFAIEGDGVLTYGMRITNIGKDNLFSFRSQGISPHYHLAAHGVLHPPQTLAHSTCVPAVLLNLRLGLISRTQIGMHIIHGLDVGAAAFVELGGADEPGLELGEGNEMVVGGIPYLLLGRVVDAATIDVVHEVLDLLVADAVGVVRVD